MLRYRIPYRIGMILKKMQYFCLPFENKQLCSSKNRYSEYYPIFVLGLPRAGSTLVYQLLVNSSECCYFSNLATTMHLSPVTVSRVTKIIGGQNPPPTFQSRYGNTSLWNEPSVGVSIWGRWFPLNQTFMKKNNLNTKMFDELRSTIYGMQNIFSAPFIGKWQGFNSVSGVMNEAFPKCFFVRVKRDYKSVAQSILKAREDTGNVQTWFSSRTSAYNEIIASTHDPVRQACLQILNLEKDLDDFFSNISKNKKITVDYADVCHNPSGAITKVFERYNNLNNKLIKTNFEEIPKTFVLSDRKNVSTLEEIKIEKTISELSEHF
ncbi:Sulfotransferase family protein [Candidatus Electrothrix aarhusensis]|uniref:Sulfotransferase family protein n=1 Tax=Candidatus Electrothrix aarhusensis TaxID=1859131 RepID=A0A3S3UBU5_9BACT|nr:Sulfotransferase family protein [Candidatus Electrothrix aarhusensis]